MTLYLRGKKYEDLTDGKASRELLSYGYGSSCANMLSSSTLSLERHHLLWPYLTRETDFFPKPLKVLHVAPEQVFYKHFKNQKNSTYIIIDLYSPLADVRADLYTLPFEDNSFDMISCNHILEHIPDDAQTVCELYRVMKEGGWGIFRIPQDINRAHVFEDDIITDSAERTHIFGQYDYVHVYGLDYFDRLRQVGFEVEEIIYSTYSTAEEIERYRIVSQEILSPCKKQ